MFSSLPVVTSILNVTCIRSYEILAFDLAIFFCLRSRTRSTLLLVRRSSQLSYFPLASCGGRCDTLQTFIFHLVSDWII